MDRQERTRLQGQRIRRARGWLGYTQGELAEKLSAELGDDISYATISRIEAGQREVTVQEMRVLVIILQQSREWLEGDDVPFDDRVNPRYLNSLFDYEKVSRSGEILLQESAIAA